MTDYDQDKVKQMAEHPVDEGCRAEEHCHKVVGIRVPVTDMVRFIKKLFSKDDGKWGFR